MRERAKHGGRETRMKQAAGSEYRKKGAANASSVNDPFTRPGFAGSTRCGALRIRNFSGRSAIREARCRGGA
jgi:hypothetical protein